MGKPDKQERPTAIAGPQAYGAYLQPPRLCGLDLPDASGRDADEAVVEAARSEGTRIYWQTTVEDVDLLMTHGGGVFALFPKQPARQDPAAHVQEQLLRTVEFLNLVACELMLACDVPCSAFSVSDIAGAIRSEDADRIETWVAPRPYAPQGMYQETDMKSGSSRVAGWERTPAEALSHLGDLAQARMLRDVSPELPALVAGAIGHHHRGRPAEATLFGWMVCERLVNHSWTARIEPAALSGSHSDQLRDNRTYTSAVRIEILRREGLLSHQDFELLSDARRARNQQAHNRPATAEDAQTTLRAMLAVLDKALGDQEQGPERLS